MTKHLVYRIKNLLNERYYIGVHSTDDPSDSYMGSGLGIKRAIEKYGIENFSKEILFVYDNLSDAFLKEKEIVQTVYQDPFSYNFNTGGKGGWGHINQDKRRINAMHLPEVSKKVSVALKEKLKDPVIREKYLSSIEKATVAAAMANLGRKFPERGKKIRAAHLAGKYANCARGRKRQTFELTSPNGDVIITDDLSKFCLDNKFPFSTLWVKSQHDNLVKRGPAKGWSITQNNI